MATDITRDAFIASINAGIPATFGDPLTEVEKNTLITRLSHAIIDLLAITPADATNVPGAKDAYIDGLTSALSALWGADKDKTRVLEVSDAPFPDATGNSGGRSSRQTRRRRNGGKRNQRR